MKGCVCLSLLLLLGLFTSVGAQASPTTTGTVSTPTPSEAPATTAKESTTVTASPSSTGNTTKALSTHATGTSSSSPAVTSAASSSSQADLSGNSSSSASPNTTTQATTKPTTSSPSPPQTTTNATDTASTANTTAPGVTSTTNTTLAPTSAATATPATNTSASSSESSSDTPTPSPSPSPSPTVPVPMAVSVVLSETNLLLASDNLFVEMKGTPTDSLANLTLVVLNGTSAAVVWKVDFNSSQIFSTSGFFVEPISTDDVRPLKTVVIGLYHSKGWDSSFPNQSLVDFMALSTDSSPAVSPSLQEALLPMDQPVTVVQRGLVLTQNLTLSRCKLDTTLKTVGAFVLTGVSRDADNRCDVKTVDHTVWTLQLLKKKGSACVPFKAYREVMEKRVENLLVGKINQRCRCGFTSLLVQVTGNFSCTLQNVLLNFTVRESYTGQTKLVINSFTELVQNKTVFTVNDEDYSAMNCTRECQPSPSHHPPGKPSKANSTVTIAVVLSSVAVFLIILIAVILYMRGKKRGIIRQFRMTRLEEDDDMDDMDDFIGGGGEASFSTRQR